MISGESNLSTFVAAALSKIERFGQCAAIVLAGLWMSDGAIAQAIDVSPRLGVGDQWRYSVSLDVLVNEENEGVTEAGRIVQSAHMTLEGVRLESDGSLVVSGSFDRITSVWRRGKLQHEFTWTRPKDEAVAPAEYTGEQIEAMTEPQIFNAIYESLATRPFELRVSSDGVIEAVAGFTGAIRLLALAEGLDNTSMGMFLPPRFGESLAPLWTADGARAIGAVGEEWTEQRGIGLGGAGALEITTNWKADRVRKDERLECSGTVSAEAIALELTAETQPTVEVRRGTGDASLVWSLADGQLLEREETLDLVSHWTLADLEMTITQLSTRRLMRLD